MHNKTRQEGHNGLRAAPQGKHLSLRSEGPDHFPIYSKHVSFRKSRLGGLILKLTQVSEDHFEMIVLCDPLCMCSHCNYTHKVLFLNSYT